MFQKTSVLSDLNHSMNVGLMATGFSWRSSWDWWEFNKRSSAQVCKWSTHFFLLSLRIPTLTDDFTTQLFVQGPNVSDKCQQLVGHGGAGVYSSLTWHFLSDCANEQCGQSGRVRRGKNTEFKFDWLLLNDNIWFCVFQPHGDGSRVHWGQF